MEIIELHSLTESQTADLLGLMEVLDSTVKVTPEVLKAALSALFLLFSI